jgi:HPt (histidine-containing phosphotransfer) domain-containing protein
MVELSFLEKFTKGDVLKMTKYITMYLNTSPEAFDKMQENIADGSWKELAVNVHSLKPQVEFMGVVGLKEVLIEIENKVREDQTQGMDSLFDRAKRMHAESMKFLQEFIDNN